MHDKNIKEKDHKLSIFLPQNLLSELEEIPFANQEKVMILI
jgi:hypothetical protein